MAGIPPAGAGSIQPTPPQDPRAEIAKKLSRATGDFVEKTNSILLTPHLADEPSTLSQYANMVNSLHEIAVQAGG